MDHQDWQVRWALYSAGIDQTVHYSSCFCTVAGKHNKLCFACLKDGIVLNLLHPTRFHGMGFFISSSMQSLDSLHIYSTLIYIIFSHIVLPYSASWFDCKDRQDDAYGGKEKPRVLSVQDQCCRSCLHQLNVIYQWLPKICTLVGCTFLVSPSLLQPTTLNGFFYTVSPFSEFPSPFSSFTGKSWKGKTVVKTCFH